MIHYSNDGYFIEVVIRDSCMKKIDAFKVQTTNVRDVTKVFGILKDKYGFNPSIHPKDSVNAKQKKEYDIFDVDVNW